MLVNQRIIWKDDSSLVDLSVELNDLAAQTYILPLVASADKIYIGSELPFNHRYFLVSSANAALSTVSVKIWTGNVWESAVDVIDQTKVGGATLAQSGIISWTTNRTKNWGREESTENISELSTLKIYDMYWVELTLSVDLTSTTALAYVGQKFAKDEDLAIYGYPHLNSSSLKDAYVSGQTTWDKQHCAAAEQIVRYLTQKNVIANRNQVWNVEQFNEAAVHKVAEIIYSSMGDDYEDQRKSADAAYMKALNLAIYVTDKNTDGHVRHYESVVSTSMRRK